MQKLRLITELAELDVKRWAEATAREIEEALADTSREWWELPDSCESEAAAIAAQEDWA